METILKNCGFIYMTILLSESPLCASRTIPITPSGEGARLLIILIRNDGILACSIDKQLDAKFDNISSLTKALTFFMRGYSCFTGAPRIGFQKISIPLVDRIPTPLLLQGCWTNLKASLVFPMQHFIRIGNISSVVLVGAEVVDLLTGLGHIPEYDFLW